MITFKVFMFIKTNPLFLVLTQMFSCLVLVGIVVVSEGGK